MIVCYHGRSSFVTAQNLRSMLCLLNQTTVLQELAEHCDEAEAAADSHLTVMVQGLGIDENLRLLYLNGEVTGRGVKLDDRKPRTGEEVCCP
jgi:hypothetical protein